jgi:4-oxalmesaconate hydratase
MENSIRELERCVLEMGFIGCNLNPDPSGGYWKDKPMGDAFWYPFYEKMVELDVPAMIHVSGACHPCMHTTSSYYLGADTTAFVHLMMSDVLKDFPTIKFIIPHGGGAVPYHWGRFRGIAQDMGLGDLDERMLNNIYFDTCVYHQDGIDMLLDVIPTKNILFASEMIGAVRGIDPRTGHYYDDTKRYIDGNTKLTDEQRTAIFEGNIRRVFPRLAI